MASASHSRARPVSSSGHPRDGQAPALAGGTGIARSSRVLLPAVRPGEVRSLGLGAGLAECYLNYATDDTAEAVEDAYGAQAFARLRAAKRTWDPGNLFRHNHNIPPAA